LQLARERDAVVNEARVLHGLALAYWSRGDLVQAATFSDEAVKAHRKGSDFQGTTAALGLNGVLAREAGNIPRALALHREAESLAPNTDFRLRAITQLAIDHLAASDYRAAIAKAREALAIDAGKSDYFRRLRAQLTLATALLDQPGSRIQDAEEAESLSRQALEPSVKRVDIGAEISARRVLAQSLAARNRLAESRLEYARAVDLIFRYRSNSTYPELQSINLASERHTLTEYVDLLMRGALARGAGKFAPASPDEQLALQVMEWQRASNFHVTRRSNREGASRSRIDELLTQMAGKRVRIAALQERASDSPAEIKLLQLDIAQLRAQVDQQRAESSAGGNSSLATSGPVQALPAPPSRTTQLSYAMGRKNTYLWVRDESGLRTTSLGVSATGFARELSVLAAGTRAQDPAKLDDALARLSSVLLPARALSGTPDVIEVVVDGELAGIPFAALLLPPERQRHVAESFSTAMISTLYAAHEQRAATRPRALTLVAMADDSRRDGVTATSRVFPSLPNAAAEVRAITSIFAKQTSPARLRLLLGSAGDAATLRNTWEAGVDVLHLATHGLADLRQPTTSLLLLPATDSNGDSTYLTAGQVREWHGDAGLVYLSACDTAVGPARFADGTPGLQQAFLRAGAHGVVATLWPVEDVYASQFAVDFYRRYTAGMPASQALSETQRAWVQPAPGIRESEQAHRRMTAWAHAYYAQ